MGERDSDPIIIRLLMQFYVHTCIPKVNMFLLIPVEDMEQYLHYIGGGAGALALTGVAAASAFYLASRPSPQKPLFPLDAQCIVQPVSGKRGSHLFNAKTAQTGERERESQNNRNDIILLSSC